MAYKKAKTNASLASKQAAIEKAKAQKAAMEKAQNMQYLNQIIQTHRQHFSGLMKTCIEAQNQDLATEIWDICVEKYDYPKRLDIVSYAASQIKAIAIPLTPKAIVDAAEKNYNTMMSLDVEKIMTDPESEKEETKVKIIQ